MPGGVSSLIVENKRGGYRPVVGNISDAGISLEVGPESTGLQTMLGVVIKVFVDNAVYVGSAIGACAAGID